MLVRLVSPPMWSGDTHFTKKKKDIQQDFVVHELNPWAVIKGVFFFFSFLWWFSCALLILMEHSAKMALPRVYIGPLQDSMGLSSQYSVQAHRKSMFFGPKCKQNYFTFIMPVAPFQVPVKMLSLTFLGWKQMINMGNRLLSSIHCYILIFKNYFGRQMLQNSNRIVFLACLVWQ